MLRSVISFPDRGPYGKASYRGNTSGWAVKALLEHYRPSLFVDPAEGSGTSGDIARELGIEYVGLDLHSGFNLVRDSLLKRVKRPCDYVFYHPAYFSMVLYSGNVWGSEPHQDDLSRCKTPEEFLEKLQVTLCNIYDAVRRAGTIRCRSGLPQERLVLVDPSRYGEHGARQFSKV